MGKVLRWSLAFAAVFVLVPAAASAAPSTTTVSCDPSPGVVVTTPTTCTATVSATADPVSGTVSFAADFTPFPPSPGSFSNGGACTLPAGSETTKQCQVTYTPLGFENFVITASYGGDATHDPSEGSTFLMFTDAIEVTTALVCDPSTFPLDTATTCTAAISQANADAAAPTGKMGFTSTLGSFSDGGVCSLQAGPQLTKQCQVIYTPIVYGSHVIFASYSGDSFHPESYAGAAMDVTPPPRATPAPSEVTANKKKCKKRKHRAPAAKKCRKKRR